MPIETALAPSVSAAAMPRPSPMPPAATIGTSQVIGEARHEREETDGLPLGRGRVERAAMAAGLEALRHDDVGAGLPARRAPRPAS